jgi:transporter family protein
MAPIVLACISAVLFGSASVWIRMALRRGADPELGALTSAVVGTVLCVIAAAIAGEGLPVGDTLKFFVAGLVAPGISQVFFFKGIQAAGAARVSVVVGMAPLVSVVIAIVLLGEPIEIALIAGAVLIVAGGVALVVERVRPEDFRVAGLWGAVIATVLFASRDNVIRWLAGDTQTPPLVAAAATFLGGTLVMTAYVAATRRGRLAKPLALATRAFLPAGLCFGLSYVALFEAYYRGRVTIVSPLVATESLWGVLFASVFLGRSELVGKRLVFGAALVVAGGALIGAFR